MMHSNLCSINPFSCGAHKRQQNENTINMYTIDTKILTSSFTSLQHLRSYQDWYELVTVRTPGDFTVLPHWEIRLLAQWSNSPLSHIILTLS